MASWQFHSLIFSKYTRGHEIPDASKKAFLLGCFAPDLVSRRQDKKETHLGFGPNRMPLFFQMNKHRKKCDPQNVTGSEMRWFYKGYLLHMEIDACWLKFCGHPFAFRYLMSSGKLKDAGVAYYDDMIEIDKYYRFKYSELQSEMESMRLLEDIRVPSYFPEILDFSKVERVTELFSATYTNEKDKIKTMFLDERKIHEFFRKICEVEI